MHIYTEPQFVENFNKMKRDLMGTTPLKVGSWQSQMIDMPIHARNCSPGWCGNWCSIALG